MMKMCKDGDPDLYRMRADHTGHLASVSKWSTPASASAKYCLARAIWNFMNACHLSSIWPVVLENMPVKTCKAK